ncbi:MAG TPA: phosphatase domain-containing protein [Rhodothermales bacterium]|nr:phosphatase domain-containing protein [Rhodothermales bacterium]
MADWKNILTHLAHQTAATAEEQFDTLRARLSDRLGHTEPLLIVPYRGFGTPDRVWIKGRVLEDKGFREAKARDTTWQNLVAAYKRFETDEVPGVRLRVRLLDAEQIVVTDPEGYFEVTLHPTEALPTDKLWHEVELELVEEAKLEGQPVGTTGEVMVPDPSQAAFGVISDVDDTILKTGATNLLRMARITFLNNARTRLPFKGVAALYQALQGGSSGEGQHPLFFVSSSPWNLYDLLVDFCEVHDIPRGPFMLRDLGIDRETFIKSSHHSHKLEQIERILRFYPDLRFILIGDSGQKDPEIYREVIDDFPERILAVYIRDVSEDARDEAVRSLIAEVEANDIPMALVADSVAAAEHAAARGFISHDALPAIRQETAQDKAAPSDVEQILGTEESADERPQEV